MKETTGSSSPTLSFSALLLGVLPLIVFNSRRRGRRPNVHSNRKAYKFLVGLIAPGVVTTEESRVCGMVVFQTEQPGSTHNTFWMSVFFRLVMNRKQPFALGQRPVYILGLCSSSIWMLVLSDPVRLDERTCLPEHQHCHYCYWKRHSLCQCSSMSNSKVQANCNKFIEFVELTSSAHTQQT